MKKIISFAHKNSVVIILLCVGLFSFRNSDISKPFSVNLEKIRVTTAGQASAWATTTADVLLVVDVAATIASATAAFPATPIDGQLFGFSSRSAITVLTLDTNGIPISGGIATLIAGGVAWWIYDAASNRWFRYH